MPNLNFGVESTVLSGCVFLLGVQGTLTWTVRNPCNLPCVCRGELPHLLPEAGALSDTHQLRESTSKGKTNGARADDASNRWIFFLTGSPGL